VDNPYGLME